MVLEARSDWSVKGRTGSHYQCAPFWEVSAILLRAYCGPPRSRQSSLNPQRLKEMSWTPLDSDAGIFYIAPTSSELAKNIMFDAQTCMQVY